MTPLNKIIPHQLGSWVRQSVPNKNASFKDIMDSVQHQAISYALLMPIIPSWRWITSKDYFIAIEIIYKALIVFYAIGAIFLVLMSIYQTVHAFNHATFFFAKKMRPRGVKRLILIGWVLTLSIVVCFSWVGLFFTK
jgi:hypothetical protein